LRIDRVRAWLDVLGGSAPLPPDVASRPAAILGLALWWVALLLLAMAFMGRYVRFVYIDF
jgi:hypothetical protein